MRQRANTAPRRTAADGGSGRRGTSRARCLRARCVSRLFLRAARILLAGSTGPHRPLPYLADLAEFRRQASGSSSTTATSCGSRARSAGNLSPRRRRRHDLLGSRVSARPTSTTARRTSASSTTPTARAASSRSPAARRLRRRYAGAAAAEGPPRSRISYALRLCVNCTTGSTLYCTDSTRVSSPQVGRRALRLNPSSIRFSRAKRKNLFRANVSTTQYLSHGGRRSYSSMNSISLRGSCAIERPHPGRVLCAGHSHL